MTANNKEEILNEIRNLIDKKAKEQYNTSQSFAATSFGLDGIPFVRRDAIAEFAYDYALQVSADLKKEIDFVIDLHKKEMAENQRLREALDSADELMRYLEDFTHGEDGNKITKERAKISTAISQDGKESGCACQECGLVYSVDVTIPDDVWNKISPKKIEGYKGGGLLCPQCIVNKLLTKDTGGKDLVKGIQS